MKDVSWYRAVAPVVTSIFIDLDNAATEEIMIAMQTDCEEKPMVFWISQSNEKRAARILLNSHRREVFASADEIEERLTSGVSK